MARPARTDGASDDSSHPARGTSWTHTAQVRRGVYGSLAGATAWFVTSSAALGVPQSIADELDFCLNELLANIVDHAFDDDEVHDVHVGLTRDADRVFLTLEDDGRAFDPIAGDTYVEPATLDAAGHRGYGIHLVRRFTDELLYHRSEGRNSVTVMKRLVHG